MVSHLKQGGILFNGKFILRVPFSASLHQVLDCCY